MVEYTDVVNTGAAWLPQIPAHWQLRRIKYSFDERSEKGYPDEPLLVASQNMGVVPKSVYGKRTVEATKDLDKLKLVMIGDYVVSLRSFQGGLEYAYYQGIISPAYTIMKPHYDFQSDYYKFLFKSAPFIKLLTTCVTGIREGQNIDYGKLKNNMIPVPPRTEQDQIVRFLDWKVSEINKLIGIRRKEISEFNELILKIADTYVTHGTRRPVDYQCTGIDWAPEIPTNWSLSKIRHHFEIKKRIAGSDGYDVFSVTQKGLKVRDIHLYEGQLAADYSGYQFVQEGEFAMNHMDLLTGGVGIADHLGVTSPDYRVFRLFDTEHCYAPYFLKILQLCYRRHAFYRFGHGAANVGRWRLPADAFLNFQIPLPPYEEQVEIVQKIAAVQGRIDAEVESLRKQIEELEELKSVVVSDVVTGKIDVRGIAVPQYEHIDDIAEDDSEDVKEETNGEEE